MKIHKEKEFKKAMTKTLHAYEELIEDPITNLKKWAHYPDQDKCNICNVYARKIQKYRSYECYRCPLNTLEIKQSPGCASDIFLYLVYYLSGGIPNLVRQAAKARYDELIKHLDKYDLEYR